MPVACILNIAPPRPTTLFSSLEGPDKTYLLEVDPNPVLSCLVEELELDPLRLGAAS
jgi:hypothetical protein